MRGHSALSFVLANCSTVANITLTIEEHLAWHQLTNNKVVQDDERFWLLLPEEPVRSHLYQSVRSPGLRQLIKPAVEVMAAIPTVIIGFLAALWLAPLIGRSLGSVFLSLILVPAALMISFLIWQAARKARVAETGQSAATSLLS